MITDVSGCSPSSNVIHSNEGLKSETSVINEVTTLGVIGTIVVKTRGENFEMVGQTIIIPTTGGLFHGKANGTTGTNPDTKLYQ